MVKVMPAHRPWLLVALPLLVIVTAACARNQGGDDAEDAAVAVAPAPVRGAVGDQDVRIMLAEIASARACAQIRGNFQALPAADQPQLTSGVLWIHGCRISNTGTRVDFHLEAGGWRWIDEEKKKAGAKFSLHQYVRFAVAADIAGTLDVGYDPRTHIASIWFSLRGEPQVKFTPVGELDVDAEGAWSSVLGAVASVMSSSPKDSAKQDAEQVGATEFKRQLARGLTVTVDLCSGLVRSELGHTPRGQMAAPGVGETKNVAVELEPGGLMIFGPQSAEDGMTVEAEVTAGNARLALVCRPQAEALAKAFLAGRAAAASAGPVLLSKDVAGKTTMQIQATRCPVSLVAQAVPGSQAPARLQWRRPTAEAIKSGGGPLLECSGR
jgi:hypothetical protein